MELPLISFGIPTYNEEEYIERCLESIFSQDYPKDKIEVIIIDDGSTDRTLGICARYPVRILHQSRGNPEAGQGKQAAKGAAGGPEAGRRIGVEAANAEFVVLFSADNELACRDWLSKMVKPVLEDREIVAVAPPVSAPREDPAINRCLALLQTTTPLEFYLLREVLDPSSLVRMRRPKEAIAKEGYSVDIAGEEYPPLVGGNGSLLRKDAVLKVGNVPATKGDIDLTCRLVKHGFTKYAHVPEAVVYHHYVRSYWEFIKRLRIRVKWFLQHPREYPWLPRQRGEFFNTLKWVLFCSTFVGPLIHGFLLRKTGDPAWLYLPFACLTAVMVYSVSFLTSKRGLSLLLGTAIAAVRGSKKHVRFAESR